VKDENFWELQHFLHLCLKGNPSTLEVLLAPTESTTPAGEELRALYPKMLQRTKVYDAHKGFARSQMHQLAKAENTDDFNKSASHYLRILYNGIELLRHGRMTVRITDTPLGETVLKARLGQLSIEEIYALGEKLQKEMDEAYANSTLPEEADLTELNEFLLRMRKENW
jgi:predicted nucleotidyltransferase